MRLKRELGPRDITLFAIASIVGVRWVASAAHAGPGSVLLWLLAALFLLLPLAVSVAALTARDPEAGGMYLWSRRDFGPWHGFLCFWIYWTATIVWFPGAAMFYSSAAVFALGPRFAWLAEDRAYLIAASLAAIWIALAANILGVRIGKWTENLGAISAWTLGLALCLCAAAAYARRGSATELRFLPSAGFDTLNFWASIAYGMTGFEVVGMMGAEIRDPVRTLPRAAWFSSIFTTLFYAGATLSLVVLMPAAKISDLNGLGQAGQTAGDLVGLPWLAPVLAILVIGSAIGQFGGLGAGVARMPYAAGADHLLPPAFARIHPRWGTPYVSMIAFGLAASVLLVAMQVGDTARAAYQTIVSLMVISGFLPYLYIFTSAWRLGHRLSAVSGLGVTAVALLCSVIPAPEINRVWLFELKLALGTAVVVGSGFAVYRLRRKD